MSLLTQAAALVAAAGLATFVLGLAATRSLVPSLSAGLELFLAAGLLRLAGQPDLRALAVTSIVLALRRVVTRTLRDDRVLLAGWGARELTGRRIWTRRSGP